MFLRILSALSWVMAVVALVVGFLELVEYTKEVSPWLGLGTATILTVGLAYITKEIFLLYNMVAR
jgi:hypothetical protein